MLTHTLSESSSVLIKNNSPVNSLRVVQTLKADARTSLPLPYYLSSISAGFPSPADDYMEKNLDLNEHLIKHPAATFFLRVAGDSMVGAGIHHGDTLIVDRSLIAKSGDIVIAAVDGQLTVKRLFKDEHNYWLVAENPHYKPIKITDTETMLWGVVTSVVHYLKK